MKNFKSLLFFLFLLSCCLPLSASIVQINGKWSDSKYAPTYSVSEHFDLGCKAANQKEWREALSNFLIITIHFQTSPFYKDALFYSGLCYYNLEDYDLANREFSTYLTQGSSLAHFEEVIEYKFQIAERFSKGSRKHLFGISRLPKWSGAKEEALTLYDEVISSLPNKEIALQALLGKAELLRNRKQFRDSVDTLNILIRRFPKHEMAALSYVRIGEVYLEESEYESQNPDLIGLATLNLQRFRKNFPGDEKIALVENNLLEMKEVYARALYDMAQFYEKKKKPKASKIYYQEAIRQYPETMSALKSKKRLEAGATR